MFNLGPASIHMKLDRKLDLNSVHYESVMLGTRWLWFTLRHILRIHLQRYGQPARVQNRV
jgi:hypothetical protein